jgi:hypothetical protein
MHNNNNNNNNKNNYNMYVGTERKLKCSVVKHCSRRSKNWFDVPEVYNERYDTVKMALFNRGQRKKKKLAV